MTVNKDAIKILRDKSGCGMMECKNALVEAGNDIEKAQEILRKTGKAQAIKKGSRNTGDGLVSISIGEEGKSGVMVEVDCETDFVAKTDDFKNLVKDVIGKLITAEKVKSVEDIPGDIKDIVVENIGRLKENIKISKFTRFTAGSPGSLITLYIHPGNKLGVLLEVKFDREESRNNEELLMIVKDISMQVAAMNPSWVKSEDVPGDVVQKEKEIYKQQAKDSGKPEKILDQIATGRLRKFYGQVCLLEQEYIKDPKQIVKEALSDAGKKTGAELNVMRFARFKVGEE